MIEYHDPEAQVATVAESYRLSCKITGSNDTRVALLANGFPDSTTFLEELAVVLTERYPGLSVQQFNKGNASAGIDDSMLADITRDSQAVVTAYGH